MIYSLDEVEKIVGMNRRKIQDYEKHGLSHKPDQQKKKSHKLMYNESHINELYRLRFYHELDYNIPMIKEDRLTEISAIERNKILTKQIRELECKIESLQKLAALGKIMCELGIEPADLIESDSIIPFDELMKILEIHKADVSEPEDFDKWLEKNTEPENYERFNALISKLKQLYSLGLETENDLVQGMLLEIFESFSFLYNNSPFIFMSSFSTLLPGTVFGEEVDQEYGNGFADFLHNAIRYFYLQRKDNPEDKQIVNAFGSISQLYVIKGLPIDSDEIMGQVDIAYNFLAKIGYLKPEDVINSLKAFNRLIFCDFITDQLPENMRFGSRVAYIINLYAIDNYARNKIGNKLSGG